MFRQGAYATVWKVEDKGRYCLVNISTSKKDRDTNTYKTDFSHGFVMFAGGAAEQAKTLQERDRIRIKECAVGNTYDKEQKRTYWNLFVYDFEIISGNQNNTPPANNTSDKVGGDDEDMPF